MIISKIINNNLDYRKYYQNLKKKYFFGWVPKCHENIQPFFSPSNKKEGFKRERAVYFRDILGLIFFCI